MARKPIPQKEQVLNHLIRYGSITPLQAITKYKILRLAPRIFDLKKVYDIHRVDVTRKVDGVRKTFSRYVWGKKEAS